MSRGGAKRPSKVSAADARAAAEAQRDALRGERQAALEGHFGDDIPGKGLIAGAVWVTVAFVIVTTLAVIVGDYMYWVSAIFDIVVFALGSVLFMLAIYSGSQRSRLFDMTMAGWFFLSGSAPKAVKSPLLGSLVVQVVVSLVAASMRPFTALAFGILVPIYGVAITAVWSAKHGYFPPRKTGDPLLRKDD